MLNDLEVLQEFRQSAAWRDIEDREEQRREKERADATRELDAATKARDRALPKLDAKLPAASQAMVRAYA
jgi:hypothetical protein